MENKVIEKGYKHSIAHFNDFHRCEKCKIGSFYNAISKKPDYRECPECGHLTPVNK